MLELQTPYDFEAYVGKKLGVSEWVTIDQKMIDAFAEVERAKKELPDGKTIAHGMLTLSLVTELGGKIVRVIERSKGINYGHNKVRFTAPVPVDSRIRLHRSLLKFEKVEGGARLTFSNEMEIEGQQRPAMVAETISMVYASGG